MHILAFLFFASVLALSVAVIRSTLTESGDRILAALAGEYHLRPAVAPRAYIARKRPAARARIPTTPGRRIAA